MTRLLNMGGGLYRVEVGGVVAGKVWLVGEHWYARLTDGTPINPHGRAGFACKEDAAAVLAEFAPS